jgi:DNA polymerase-3 subunit beta
MKLSVLQENFSKGLSIITRTVATRIQLPVLANVLLLTDKGRLKLSATNLETGVNFWIGAKVEKEGAISVPAKILSEFVSSLPADKVNIEAKESVLRIDSGPHHGEFVGLPAGEFPSIPTLSGKPAFEFEPKILSEAVFQVAFSAAQDETRPVLSGVLLQVKGNDLVMVATDGYRLSFKKLVEAKGIVEAKEFKKGVIIPAGTLMEVGRLVSDKSTEGKLGLTFTLEANQVIFSTPEFEVVSRLIEGQFPDFEKILPEKGLTKVVADKEEFLRAAKIASIFARESANVIRLEVEKNQLRLSANTAQVGSNLSDVEAKVEGEGGKIAFNSRYLLDFLNSTNAESVKLEISGPLNPGIFTPSDDSTYLHVIMPVRVQG